MCGHMYFASEFMKHNDSLDSVNLLQSMEVTSTVEVTLRLQCMLVIGNSRQGYFQDNRWIRN